MLGFNEVKSSFINKHDNKVKMGEGMFICHQPYYNVEILNTFMWMWSKQAEIKCLNEMVTRVRFFICIRTVSVYYFLLIQLTTSNPKMDSLHPFTCPSPSHGMTAYLHIDSLHSFTCHKPLTWDDRTHMESFPTFVYNTLPHWMTYGPGQFSSHISL